MGSTTESVDCSVDKTRYDLTHLEGAAGGWRQVWNTVDDRPANVIPITDFSNPSALGYEDTCGSIPSTLSDDALSEHTVRSL